MARTNLKDLGEVKDNSVSEAQEASAVQEGKVNALQTAIDKAIAEGKITTAPSLKAMASVFQVNPNRIYSVAKQPREGEIYDARVYNWDALERFVTKRLDGGQTLDQFIDLAIAKDVELKTADRRTGTRTSAEDKFIKTSAGLMPVRKFDLALGQKVLTKKDVDSVFEVVMMTDTHIVLQLEGTGELKVFANWTANSQIIAPSRFDEVMASREAKKAETSTEAAAE